MAVPWRLEGWQPANEEMGVSWRLERVAGVRKLVDGSTEASGDVSDSGEASVDVDSGEASGAEVDDSGVDGWIPSPHNGSVCCSQ